MSSKLEDRSDTDSNKDIAIMMTQMRSLSILTLIVSILYPTDAVSSKLRLYLIRHGESEANKQGIYAGQNNAVLTDQGRKEAQALGRTKLMAETPFWRFYSSDLSRAHETALHILQTAQRDLSALHLEKKLRERSYGPRQGMPRTISVEDAIEIWRQREEEPPFWETDDDLWNRSSEFIQDLLEEIKTLESLIDSVQGDLPSVYHVFITCHSGIIRILLEKLVGQDRLVRLGASCDANRNNRILIPNTSVSILEIDTGKKQPFEEIEVLDLTNAKHLDSVKLYDD